MNSKFRILVLDDDRDLLELIRRTLSKNPNLDVVIANTVEDAMRLLPKVDAVIADCVLPDVQEFNDVVQKSGKPVIRMSGKIDRATNLEISKPFTSRQLMEAVDMLKFFHSPAHQKKKLKFAA